MSHNSQNNVEMIHFLIKPSEFVSGISKVPGDKSVSHRAIILASIATGKTIITNALMGEDNLATLKVFNQLGVQSKISAKTIEINGVGLNGLKAAKNKLDLGNSGTAIRLLTGLLAAQKFKSILTGDESLLKRPMARITKPLKLMGAKIELKNNQFAPIKISPAHLYGEEIKLKIASAQVKSAILLAGLYASGKTSVYFPETSRNHTELMLEYLGVNIQTQKNKITIYQQTEEIKAKDINVIGDFSSACFLIAAALLAKKTNKNLIIQDVGINPTRNSALKIMQMMGADIEIKNKRKLNFEAICDLEVKPSHLSGIEIPSELIAVAIDEIPVLMVLAAFAQGKTILKGASELRLKESDRISSVIYNLKKLGIECEEFEDGMSVIGLAKSKDFHPSLKQKTIQLDSFGDHRIAMAFSLVGLKMKQNIELKNCNNVATSFPNFSELMKKLGLNIAKKIITQ